MAGLEACLSTLSLRNFPSSKSISSPKSSHSFIKLHISNPAPTLSLNFALGTLLGPTRWKSWNLLSASCSATEEAALEPNPETTQQQNLKRKLFVLNLPWSFTVTDIKELFGQCGTVADVEIIKHKDGKNRGFAFVTMAAGEGALAAVDRFDAQQVSGRVIRVQFARRFKRPSPTPAPVASKETRYKLYVSNLDWKVRSTHLRELFSAKFNPASCRVVFGTPSGKSAGYGFVSFATKEEAEAAISALDGKELMGRPIRLKLNEKNADVPESENSDEDRLSKGKAEENSTPRALGDPQNV